MTVKGGLNGDIWCSGDSGPKTYELSYLFGAGDALTGVFLAGAAFFTDPFLTGVFLAGVRRAGVLGMLLNDGR